MQALRRTSFATARAARLQLSRQCRRYAHDSHHHEEVSESFGLKFYIGLATVPGLYFLYTFSQSGADGSDPALTRMIDSWTTKREEWARINTLHTNLVEQAAADRHLFLGQKPNTNIDLKTPEMIHAHSECNIPAGGILDISKTVAKYTKENYEAQEKKLQQLRDGTLAAEQPISTKPRSTSNNP
ncbi:hypothetical protein EJ05DRAFT_479693 [Pseudovirgaria hyperparasitica]|uniref:NADH-ubiquinone oxidoreductase 17.8 kDa subunit n=1 Tax=Pseudovirgaria hyperparasitica TaxID=470096 RepID=A0A6A6VWQ3_9PEZI|nr:uncharacterized protein EJ05DRAFT_479693 [Pseudovirgaria hyperparasitica]KAF2754144.1 hypothetical protein EJ05DRAFT_479693 [Pseudovirgaria hyperparasitica]